MSPLDFFREYRADRRARNFPGFALENFPDLCRHTALYSGQQGTVSFAELTAATADERIEEQIRHFDQLDQPFEWKVHDFDEPTSLKSLLETRGFGCGDAEAFLVADVTEWTATGVRPSDVHVERITDLKGLRDIVGVADTVWQEPLPGRLERYSRELTTAPEMTSFYCAYVAGHPVAGGRIEFPVDSKIASLWGGGVLASNRGRGIYSALLAVRIAEAKARGYRYITVDAEPMSRPILLRKGFQHVCWTYPMRRQNGDRSTPR